MSPKPVEDFAIPNQYIDRDKLTEHSKKRYLTFMNISFNLSTKKKKKKKRNC